MSTAATDSLAHRFLTTGSPEEFARGHLPGFVPAPGGDWRSLLFGALMNLWFWPFSPPGALSWSPGMGLAETLRRYGAFYALTSFAWDSLRALGNMLLILTLGGPVLKELRRFKSRFEFTVE